MNSKEYTFPVGHVFTSEDDTQYRVTGFLGQGGQGEAYRVAGDGGEYAAKWYHSDRYLNKINAEEFGKNLRKNVLRGAPKLSNGKVAEEFIWPLKMLREEQGSFGYIMRIFPKGYEPMRNVIMLSRHDPDKGTRIPLSWKSWFVCITAALNIVSAFEILHACGLSYQDINDGGISINMLTGDVLICDCDNVSPDKSNLGIRGIVTYMAPEVVLNQKLPDRLTDQYSLAVILFRLFFHGHPMHGVESRKLNNDARISQQDALLRIYGSQPHYCLATKNNPNPPAKNANPDVLRLYTTFPLCLLNAFEQVFTKGVNDPMQRLTATEWRKVLLEVRDSLLLVDGAESFYRLRVPKALPPECRTLVYPHGREVLLMPGKVLYQYHLDEYGTDYETTVGKIIPTVKPGIIGLLNESSSTIRFSLEGKYGECANTGRMPLLPGMTLEINNLKLKVK